MGVVKRVMGVVGVVVVAAALVAGPVRADDESDQQAFVARINDLRTGNGVPPLVVDDRLVGMARAWAVRMAADGNLAHNPDVSTQAPAGWALMARTWACPAPTCSCSTMRSWPAPTTSPTSSTPASPRWASAWS